MFKPPEEQNVISFSRKKVKSTTGHIIYTIILIFFVFRKILFIIVHSCVKEIMKERVMLRLIVNYFCLKRKERGYKKKARI